MAIVTLLTDSGESDHYVAAIKAKILSINSEIKTIDISHQIEPCDVAQAAFILNAVFRDFPKGTVHLIGINATGNSADACLALQIEDHFFVGSDNGFFGLISEKPNQHIVELNTLNPIISSFPEKEIFAVAAAKIASGMALNELGKSMPSFKRMMNRQVKITKEKISGNIVRIDNYGNLITNIPKLDFEILSKGKKFKIICGGEIFNKIHTYYYQAQRGELFLIFNTLELLEIGMFNGRANDLLGMSVDSPVNVIFE